MRTNTKALIIILAFMGLLALVAMSNGIVNKVIKSKAEVEADQALFAKQVHDEVNRVRIIEYGLNGLAWNDKLAENATAWSKVMYDTDKFEHGGNYFSLHLSNHCGQNLFMSTGFETPASVVKAWMDSPGHRLNLLRPNYTIEGIGVYNGYVTQNFC